MLQVVLFISRYIKTLSGRKRYLDKINHGKWGEQAKAERQAVNSICQVRIKNHKYQLVNECSSHSPNSLLGIARKNHACSRLIRK